VSENGATPEERELIRTALLRMRARSTAVVFAMVGGAGILVATWWLVIRGGPRVGPHLSLLANYFPGYTVTWAGGLLGFVYGAIVGAAVGWTLASLYNRFADPSRAH